MRKAHINLNDIKFHAYAVANEPVYEGSDPTDSSISSVSPAPAHRRNVRSSVTRTSAPASSWHGYSNNNHAVSSWNTAPSYGGGANFTSVHTPAQHPVPQPAHPSRPPDRRPYQETNNSQYTYMSDTFMERHPHHNGTYPGHVVDPRDSASEATAQTSSWETDTQHDATPADHGGGLHAPIFTAIPQYFPDTARASNPVAASSNSVPYPPPAPKANPNLHPVLTPRPPTNVHRTDPAPPFTTPRTRHRQPDDASERVRPPQATASPVILFTQVEPNSRRSSRSSSSSSRSPASSFSRPRSGSSVTSVSSGIPDSGYSSASHHEPVASRRPPSSYYTRLDGAKDSRRIKREDERKRRGS